MNNSLSPFEKRRRDSERLAQRRRAHARRRAIVFVITTLVAVTVITAIVFALNPLRERLEQNRAQQNAGVLTDGNIPYGPELSYYDPLEATTDYVEIPRDQLYRGACILVNRGAEFHFDLAEAPVSIFDLKSASYSVRDKSLKLNTEMIAALNKLFDAFEKEKDVHDLMVNSAYRTYEEQQEIYAEYVETRGEDYAKQYVSDPGFSEHHSGLAADIAVYADIGIYAIRDEEPYSWIYQNMAEYGFILRYPQGKEDVTGISYESWHLRYVTVPHALLIKRQGYCLEEYMDYIKIYTYEGTHASVSSASGTSYEIYFVPVTDDAMQTIPVPKNGKYEILGNNTDGFLVSVEMQSGQTSPT